MHALQARAPLADPAPAAGASGLLATASSFFSTLTGVPSMGGSLSRGGTSSSLQQHTLNAGSQEFGDEAALANEGALDPSALPCRSSRHACLRHFSSHKSATRFR